MSILEIIAATMGVLSVWYARKNNVLVFPTGIVKVGSERMQKCLAISKYRFVDVSSPVFCRIKFTSEYESIPQPSMVLVQSAERNDDEKARRKINLRWGYIMLPEKGP